MAPPPRSRPLVLLYKGVQFPATFALFTITIYDKRCFMKRVTPHVTRTCSRCSCRRATCMSGAQESKLNSATKPACWLTHWSCRSWDVGPEVSSEKSSEMATMPHSLRAHDRGCCNLGVSVQPSSPVLTSLTLSALWRCSRLGIRLCWVFEVQVE